MSFLPSRLLLISLALLALNSVPAVVLGRGLWVVLAAATLLGWAVWQRLAWESDLVVSCRRRPPLVGHLGREGRIELQLRSHIGQPVWVELMDGCPWQLGAGEQLHRVVLQPYQVAILSYRICPRSRGAVAFGLVRLRLRRRWDLVERIFEQDIGGQLRVLPDLTGLGTHGTHTALQRLRAGGRRKVRVLGREGEFDRLRDFVPGDDLRHVDWKATARLGRPLTRRFQAERSQKLLVAVDASRLMASRSGSGTKLDHAVQAALMLTFAALEQGDQVGVAVFDHGVRAYLPPRPGKAQFRRVLSLLYDQQPVRSVPCYREVARVLAGAHRRRALVVWLTDLVDQQQGRDLGAALVALRSRHLNLVVAIDDPEVAALARQIPGDDAQLFAVAAATQAVADRRLLLRGLELRCSSLLASSPAEVGADLVAKYLDLKLAGRL